MKNFIRKITPLFLLSFYRDKKKKFRNQSLQAQKSTGVALNVDDLFSQLKKMGIEEGDTLLVHSSMSKIGYLENGPASLVNALIKLVGEQGNVLMPTSPSASYTKEYITKNRVFEALKTPSRMGAVTEYFRKLPNVKRSLHPTEPVCALGPKATYLVEGHFQEITPYTKKSPFYRVSELEGKILMIGVTLDNAGTNLHTLEDAVENFKFPVYDDIIYDAEVIDMQGQKHVVKTKVHSIKQAKKRKCDQLLPMFEDQGVVTYHQLGEAKCLLLNARKMFDVMVEQYNKNGITMYTPQGS